MRSTSHEAASTGKSTGEIHHDIELKLAIATDGAMVNLKGGLPVIVDGQVIGGIGWIGYRRTGPRDRERSAGVACRGKGFLRCNFNLRSDESPKMDRLLKARGIITRQHARTSFPHVYAIRLGSRCRLPATRRCDA